MRPFNLLILTNPPRTPALLMGGVKSQLRFHQLIVFLNLVVQSHLCLCFLTQIYVHTSTLITVQVIIVSEGLRHTNLSRQRHRLAYPGQLGQPICDSALKNTSEAVTSFQGANNTGEAEAPLIGKPLHPPAQTRCRAFRKAPAQLRLQTSHPTASLPTQRTTGENPQLGQISSLPTFHPLKFLCTLLKYGSLSLVNAGEFFQQENVLFKCKETRIFFFFSVSLQKQSNT